MTPLPFVWPYALVFWVIDIWAYWPEMQLLRRSKKGTVQDAKSKLVITLGNGIASLVAFVLAWIPALQIREHRVGWFFVGVALLVSGSLLRRHCWRMLGASFTGDVRARADQPVISGGAYSLLRHPSYTAGTILNISVGLALGSWASAGLLLVSALAVYSYRIRVEERVLLATIGEPYARFIRTRKRLIPFVY